MAYSKNPRPEVPPGVVEVSGAKGETVLVEAGRDSIRGSYTKRFELRPGEYESLLEVAHLFVAAEGRLAELLTELGQLLADDQASADAELARIESSACDR
jgi:hypothetical protein